MKMNVEDSINFDAEQNMQERKWWWKADGFKIRSNNSKHFQPGEQHLQLSEGRESKLSGLSETGECFAAAQINLQNRAEALVSQYSCFVSKNFFEPQNDRLRFSDTFNFKRRRADEHPSSLYCLIYTVRLDCLNFEHPRLKMLPNISDNILPHKSLCSVSTPNDVPFDDGESEPEASLSFLEHIYQCTNIFAQKTYFEDFLQQFTFDLHPLGLLSSSSHSDYTGKVIPTTLCTPQENDHIFSTYTKHTSASVIRSMDLNPNPKYDLHTNTCNCSPPDETAKFNEHIAAIYRICRSLLVYSVWNLYDFKHYVELLRFLNNFEHLYDSIPELLLCKAKCLNSIGRFRECILFLSDVNLSALDNEIGSSLCLTFAEAYITVGVIELGNEIYKNAIRYWNRNPKNIYHYNMHSHYLYMNHCNLCAGRKNYKRSTDDIDKFDASIHNSLNDGITVVGPAILVALDRLVGKGVLTRSEEVELINEISWESYYCKYLKYIFMSRLSNVPIQHMGKDRFGFVYHHNVELASYHGPSFKRILSLISSMELCKSLPRSLIESPRMARVYAERFIKNYDYETAYGLCKYILKNDPFDIEALSLKICCMVAIRAAHDELIELVYRLKRDMQGHPISSFAEGSAYYCRGRHDVAAKKFHRAMKMSRSWFLVRLSCGHAYSLSGQSNLAVLVFHDAAKLQNMNYLPYLYLAMEDSIITKDTNSLHCLNSTTNLKDTMNLNKENRLNRAEMFLHQAFELNQYDPCVLNEYGILENNRSKYASAVCWFQRAIKASKCIGGDCSIYYSNLGYAYLRLTNYAAAIEAFYNSILINELDSYAWLGVGIALYQEGHEDTLHVLERAMLVSDSFCRLKAKLLYKWALEDYDKLNEFTYSCISINCLNRICKESKMEEDDWETVKSNGSHSTAENKQEIRIFKRDSNVTIDLQRIVDSYSSSINKK